MKSNEGFTGRLGFVLSAAGSAVGLGNIWRFPYLTAKYGGGIFLLTYLVLMLTFGYSLLMAENCIGRMTRKGPIGAYRELCKGHKSFLGLIRFGGYINAIVPLIIVPYYCVIGGWIIKYFAASLIEPSASFSKDIPGASESYFSTFITSTWAPLGCFAIFVALVVAINAFGVRKGVERFNRICMPVLVVMILGLCIYCAQLPNAIDGIKYYLMPDFSRFSYMTLVAAMGQLFFSLSIAMGIMITYGSYMRKGSNLLSSVNQVEIFDTGIAFISGLMIIPAVVAFGGRAAAESAGPGLVFITMPQVFTTITGGRIVGVAFFFFVLFAAVTSALSILETNIQTISQELKISRTKAIIIAVSETVVIGVITILGYSVFKDFRPLEFITLCKDCNILDTLDFISNSVLMPVAAIFTTMLVVCVVGLERFCKKICGKKRRWYRRFVFQLCMALLVIPGLLVILLNSLGIII